MRVRVCVRACVSVYACACERAYATRYAMTVTPTGPYQVIDFFNEVDRDRSGSIDKEEFLDFVKTHAVAH